MPYTPHATVACWLVSYLACCACMVCCACTGCCKTIVVLHALLRSQTSCIRHLVLHIWSCIRWSHLHVMATHYLSVSTAHEMLSDAPSVLQHSCMLMSECVLDPSQVDVYSFGVVLWELWTGREPYDGLNYHALLHQITTSKGLVRPPMPNSPEWEHPPLPELVPGYTGLIEACWEEDPSKRPTYVPCPRPHTLLGHDCGSTLLTMIGLLHSRSRLHACSSGICMLQCLPKVAARLCIGQAARCARHASACVTYALTAIATTV